MQVCLPRETCTLQVSERNAPRFSNGLVTSWQWYICQVIKALILTVFPQEDLTSPDGTILPVSATIQAETDHRTISGVLVVRQARGQVCVVVLHPD
jgi:hypothetical protein